MDVNEFNCVMRVLVDAGDAAVWLMVLNEQYPLEMGESIGE